jgi:L-lactate dehydrogenase
LGRHVGVDSQHIHGYVIGEHGDSEVLTWSLATVAGLPLEEFCSKRGIPIDQTIRDQIDHNVRNAAYHIIGGKGATYYGIGSALARIADVILHDQRAILTICTPVSDIAGVANVTVALPHLVGGAGSLGSFSLALDEDEQNRLRKSAATIRKIIDDLAAETGEAL